MEVHLALEDNDDDEDVDGEVPEEEVEEEKEAMQSEDEEAEADYEVAVEEEKEEEEEAEAARQDGVRRAAELGQAALETNIERLFGLAIVEASLRGQEATRTEILHAKRLTEAGIVKRLPLDIGFATTCLGRAFQLLPQLFMNMALAAPYRHDMMFCVVLFRGATEDNLCF